MGEWHTVLISRTGLLSEVAIDRQKRIFQLGAGSFTQVSLRQHLYLGGVPSFDIISPSIPIRKSFSGCIQKVITFRPNSGSLGPFIYANPIIRVPRYLRLLFDVSSIIISHHQIKINNTDNRHLTLV